MITLNELNHTLTRVGDAVLALTTRTPPSRSRELCELLKGVVWILGGDIQGVDTPTRREARRQLRIETAALLSEIELALRHPTGANYGGVRHRARTWNDLLLHVRPTLGIPLGVPAPRIPPPLLVGAERRPATPHPASRIGSLFT